MVQHRSTERGMNFVVVQRIIRFDGRVHDWPALYLVAPNESVAGFPARVEILDRYFAENNKLSNEWRWMVAVSIGLFVDYCMAKWISAGGRPPFTSDRGLERWLLRGFAEVILNGTVQVENGKRVDRLGLYWPRRKDDRATRYLAALTGYFTFLSNEGYGEKWTQAADLEMAARDPRVAFRLSAGAAIRSNFRFLAHIPTKSRRPSHAFYGIVGPSKGAPPVPSFPSRYIVPLIANGFTCDTALLVTLLLAGAGLRSSEPFHLFTTDVQFAEQPVIFLHNPENGQVIDRHGKQVSRQDYLSGFSLVPRTLVEGAFHAGWKGISNDEHGPPAFWLPNNSLVELLRNLLRKYLLVTRPAIMARRRKSLGDHPFLFVSSGQASDGRGCEVGDPYTLSAYRSAWDAAIRRLSRIENDPNLVVRKSLGTTPHGLRHHYGRYLMTLGVEGQYIKEAMHHVSIYSHLIYTALYPSEVSAMLNKAAEAGAIDLRSLHKNFVGQFMDRAPPRHWRASPRA